MVRITTDKGYILTGVKGLDEELGGGIHIGSLVFIEGQPQTGKSVLSQYLTYGALRALGNAVAYYTSGNDGVRGLLRQMNSLSLNVQDDFLVDYLRIYPLNLRNDFDNPQEPLRLLTDHLWNLPPRFSLVVLDSITTFMTKVSSAAALDFFFACRELCQQNRSIILVADSHAFKKGIVERAREICDDYLRVRLEYQRLNPEQVGKRLIRILEVPKLHGVGRPRREGIKFEIKPHSGISILPFSEVKI